MEISVSDARWTCRAARHVPAGLRDQRQFLDGRVLPETQFPCRKAQSVFEPQGIGVGFGFRHLPEVCALAPDFFRRHVGLRRLELDMLVEGEYRASHEAHFRARIIGIREAPIVNELGCNESVPKPRGPRESLVPTGIVRHEMGFLLVVENLSTISEAEYCTAQLASQ